MIDVLNIPLMMMHQRKISVIIILQAVMKKGYPKKAANPSRTTSDTTLVLGFVTLTVC